MFNPGELEGEVDHSFFDSDGAEGSVSRDAGDGRRKTDKGLSVEKESRPAHAKKQIDQSERNDRGRASSESSAASAEDKKGRNKRSPNKPVKNGRTRTLSPALTDRSVDADSESSSSSRKDKNNLQFSPLSSPNKSSLPRRVRGTRVRSAGSRDVSDSHTEDSDYSVTDVSSLSSADCSPLHSVALNHTKAGKQQTHPEKSLPSSGLNNIHRQDHSDQDVDKCSVRSEPRSERVIHCPGWKNRKNYSFSNDEVRKIDRENQRLLREISLISPGSPRPESRDGRKSRSSPGIRLAHSALNRQREQQRIESENLSFLKRLESVKPTPGLKRSEQLADYQRHVAYMGAPYSSTCVFTTQRDRPTSKTPSGSRPSSKTPSVSSQRHASSSRRSFSAASSTAESGSTARSRSRKSAARPAWC